MTGIYSLWGTFIMLKIRLSVIVLFSAALLCAEHPLLTKANELRKKIREIRLLNCYHCIRMKNVKFTRRMVVHRQDDGRNGIFTCICIDCYGDKRSHKSHRLEGKGKLDKKPCNIEYTCKLHNITWRQEDADRCRPLYQPTQRYDAKLRKYQKELRQVEAQINQLKRDGMWDPKGDSAPATTKGESAPSAQPPAQPAAPAVKKIRLHLGLEQRVLFSLSGGNLKIGSDINNVGISQSLRTRHPSVYFSTPQCRIIYYNGKSSVWNFKTPLYPGMTVSRIVDVKLVRSGRKEVQLRRPEKAGTYKYCANGITFTSKQLLIWDYQADASEYMIDIFFE